MLHPHQTPLLQHTGSNSRHVVLWRATFSLILGIILFATWQHLWNGGDPVVALRTAAPARPPQTFSRGRWGSTALLTSSSTSAATSELAPDTESVAPEPEDSKRPAAFSLPTHWVLIGVGIGMALSSFCNYKWVHYQPMVMASVVSNKAEGTPDAAMTTTYQRLADLLEERLKSLAEGQQWWVSIAGGPGAGKSTLAEAVASLLNEKCNAEVSVVLPMDGFHYSRAQLRDIANANSEAGLTFDDLIARRGSPWTFDASAFCSALADVKEKKEGSLPIYSRQKSDPVPDGVQLKKNHRIVLVEGNYLLLYDDPLWAPLKDIFDERWFLRCPSVEEQRQRLVLRHLETWTPEKDRLWGFGKVGAAAKVDSNDLMNIHLVNETSKYADMIIDSLT